MLCHESFRRNQPARSRIGRDGLQNLPELVAFRAVRIQLCGEFQIVRGNMLGAGHIAIMPQWDGETPGSAWTPTR